MEKVAYSMKSRLARLPLPRLARLALLYTRDDDLERVVRRALLGTGTILLIARTVEDALQIVGRRGRELDVAIIAFSEACHGITLLSAIHGCCEQLPTLVVVDEDSEHAEYPRLREWRTLLPERTRIASGTGQCYRRFAAGRPATRPRLRRQELLA